MADSDREGPTYDSRWSHSRGWVANGRLPGSVRLHIRADCRARTGRSGAVKELRVPFLLVVPGADTIAPVPAALEVACKAPGTQLFRSAGGHCDVYEGGAGFADVMRTEVDFLHLHAKTQSKREAARTPVPD